MRAAVWLCLLTFASVGPLLGGRATVYLLNKYDYVLGIKNSFT